MDQNVQHIAPARNASNKGTHSTAQSRTITVERQLLSNLLESNEYEIADRIQQSTTRTRIDAFDSELDRQILTYLYADRAQLRHLLGLDLIESVTICGDGGTFAVNPRGVPKGALPEAYRHILRVDLPAWYAENPESAHHPVKELNLQDLGYLYREADRIRYQAPDRESVTDTTVLS